MIRASFIMEQHIGHYTFYQNLRRAIEEQANLIHPSWHPVTYSTRLDPLAKLPILNRLIGPLNGWLQTSAALRQSADVVIFNTQVPAALTAFQLGKRPYILSTDIAPSQYDAMSEVYEHQSSEKESIASRYKYRVNRRLFQNAALILPWSKWAAEAIQRDYDVPAERIHIFPPTVDTSVWFPIPKQQRDKLRILFVGGKFARKGGHDLLEAFGRLPAGSAELHIVTRENIPSMENVVVYNNLTPNSDTLISLFKSSDLFVLPTHAEAFGIVFLEAASTGLPIIATNVGGISDVVEHGQNGFLVNVGDVDALVNALSRLIDAPQLRQKMGQASLEKTKRQFCSQKNVVELMARINDII